MHKTRIWSAEPLLCCFVPLAGVSCTYNLKKMSLDQSDGLSTNIIHSSGKNSKFVICSLHSVMNRKVYYCAIIRDYAHNLTYKVNNYGNINVQHLFQKSILGFLLNNV